MTTCKDLDHYNYSRLNFFCFSMAVDEEDQSKDASLSDPDKALEELENIEKTTRKIFDDEESSKRSATSDSASEPVSKKARVEESSEEADNSVQIPDAEEKRLKFFFLSSK